MRAVVWIAESTWEACVDRARELVRGSASMDHYYERLMDDLGRLDGPGAVQAAISTFAVERSLERIGDHSTIIGARVLYLLTGNPDHLTREVR